MSKWIIIIGIFTALAYELELYNDCDGYYCGDTPLIQPEGK
ncbi:MAG: hypothetical protein Q4A60_06660 [Pasteurellaceae bacterium]|nr:hypothetical protein [Pasteurellaceae bacterium]